MRVLFLQRQPCIRALKYAVALRGARPGVRLGFACQGATLSGWYGEGDELFDAWWRLGSRPAGDLAAVLDEFAPDVVHSHNLPDELTVVALDVADGCVPVVHDVHDLQSLRHTAYEDGFAEPADTAALERRAVEDSAALVTVSEEMRRQVRARHRVPARGCDFPNYALARDLPAVLPPPRPPRDGRLRMVYQGTLSTNGGHYDLRDIFTAIVAQGVSLDVHPSRPAPAYEELADRTPGLRCHRPLPPARLLAALASYDLGWAGFNATLNAAHLDTALPNKVFEYLGSGLPVVVLRHRALERLVDEHGVGIVLSRVEHLAARLHEADLPALRARVAEARAGFTVEANIGRILDLYDSVAPAAGARP
ncbi:MAG: glycosyltransferase [Actinomycetota bacterium]|nr:glycosyltransferase [Actinomycetota bacterium]